MASHAALGIELSASSQTNWNPDDRRAPYALQKQAALLDKKPDFDLVAGPVRQLTQSPLNNTWATTHDAKVLRLVGGKHGPLPRALQLSDFGRFARGSFSVANPPHNAPMFRCAAHSHHHLRTPHAGCLVSGSD